jgi:2-hydroxy-6-oxonona-2,4-dienedioate hydrolase
MNQAVNPNMLEAAAILRTTACGDGKICWRIWGKGSPLVLLHGNSGSWTHWVRNIDALAAWHTLYVPDLPGCGDSDPLPDPPTFAGLAAALWAGLDELLAARPTLGLAGFSFGSVVAECLALERPRQIRRLALLRGGFNDKPPRMPEGLVRWKQISDPEQLAAAQRNNLAVMMFHDSTKIDALAVSLQTENTRRAVADAASYFPSRPLGMLARIEAPVTAIAGEFDCFSQPDIAAQEIALKQARPDACLHVIPRAGHWVMYEAAEAVNALLLQTFADTGDR